MAANEFTMAAQWIVYDADENFVGTVYERKYPAVKYIARDPSGNQVKDGEFWDEDPSGSGYLEHEDAARALVAHMATAPRNAGQLFAVTWKDATEEQRRVTGTEEEVTDTVTTLLQHAENGWTVTDLDIRDPLGQNVTDDFIRGLRTRGETVHDGATPI